MNRLAALYARVRRYPLGTRLFSRAVTWRAPYFASISPHIRELRSGLCEVAIRDRRAVHNHLGTVNAIALCAMCELAAGTMVEASLPTSLRWIPRGMSVRYLKKAEGALLARAEAPPFEATLHGDVIVPVRVTNRAGEAVMEADITMYVSPRRAA